MLAMLGAGDIQINPTGSCPQEQWLNSIVTSNGKLYP